MRRYLASRFGNGDFQKEKTLDRERGATRIRAVQSLNTQYIVVVSS
jgi:hypothetical protein